MYQTINLYGIKKHSLVNGPGIRYVLFLQGCYHNCHGCQNPESHDPNKGTVVNLNEIMNNILNDNKITGITLSGGEPLLQANICCKIAHDCKQHGLNVWVYTGFKYEEIIKGIAGENAKKLLEYIDVLVDGRFEIENRSETCKWRGSTNQRIIDIPATLANKSKSVIEIIDC